MDTNEIISSITDKVKDTANVNVVFGDPIETPGGVTIIPVASVKLGGGGGGGRNRRGGDDENQPSGNGVGLGVSVTARPLGYIEVKEGEARFVKVVDTTKIAASAMVTAPLLLLMAMRLMRFRNWKRRMRMLPRIPRLPRLA
jgi:uncharacterized spore protein YtfJ